MSSDKAERRSQHFEVSSGDLAGLDALGAEALAVFCWSDVRPLRGVAGFLDWRLCGALSRALQSGDFAAEAGELMLLPSNGRLGRRRLFVFGLGPIAQVDSEGLRRVSRRAAEVVRRAGADKVAFAAPKGPHGSEIEETFLRVIESEFQNDAELIHVVLMENAHR